MRDRFHWPPLLGLCDGPRQPRVAVAQGIPGGRESHPGSPAFPPRLRLSDPERSTPDTILRWYRHLVAWKSDGSPQLGYPGRPRVSPEGYIGSSFPRISQRLSFGYLQGVKQPVLIAFAYLSL